MNRDLDEQLSEMGGAYREVVDRLVAAYRPLPAAFPPPAAAAPRRGRVLGWSVAYLVAASLLVSLGLGVIFRLASPPPANVLASAAGLPTNAFALAPLGSAAALAEILRTQNADGSWQTDYLTKQNAAALRLCHTDAAQIAYKKAVRNLRTRGIVL